MGEVLEINTAADAAPATPAADAKKRGRPQKPRPVARAGIPCVDVSEGRLHHAFDESIDLLADAEGVYCREALLVKLEDGELTQLSRSMVRVELSRLANFVKNDEVVNPPIEVANAVFEAGRYPSMKSLKGITKHPILLKEGNLSCAGYDDETQLFGAFDPAEFSVPERPTREDASKAVALMAEMLQTFDLDQTHDHGTALAAMMTAVCRPTLRTAPLVLISAPVAGAGKGLLARCIAMLATPVEPVALTFGDDPGEFKKELISRLKSAKQVLFFDEVSGGEIDSPELRTLATSEIFGGRILGMTQDVELSTRTLVVFTGNNVTPSADTARRMTEIRMRPAVETPSLRSFNFDPITFVTTRRAEIVSAVLTIQRAYLQAGSPKLDVPPTGSFEDWDRWVRWPLIFATDKSFDPTTRMQEGIKHDPQKNELVAMLSAWRACLQGEKVTASQIIEKVSSTMTSPEVKALRAAITDAVGARGGEISPRAFGKYLSRSRDRLAGGFVLSDAGMLDGRQRWMVRPHTG